MEGVHLFLIRRRTLQILFHALARRERNQAWWFCVDTKDL